MHEVKVKGILSNRNGMNLYRGCSHGCIYCDARSNCYQINHVFEDIEVKINALELLENNLKKKRKKCMIGTGSMSDPYMHVNDKYNHTRKSLEIVEKYGFGATLITKSSKVLNDLDILKKINEKTRCVIQMTLTTFDENLCKILEPNVSTTKERFQALEILRDNNIPTIVWLSPLLPFINDTEENLNGILDYCIRAKVKGILCYGMGLTLRDGNREFFYSKLDKYFPNIKEKYINCYGNKYEISSPNSKILWNIFIKRCKENKIIYNIDEIWEFLRFFPENKDKKEQLSLF
ncbi:SPL family radical SAM protein [Fusobacterium sp. PH5-44]|uniref:SPL family radical SAM protein n=1 Tax=unclassified Fusobacterium TaxID=2648384 RepID=UPI003D255072